MMKHLFHIHCKEATMLFTQQQEQKLSATKRFALAIHLLYCRSCKRFRQQLMIITKSLKHLSTTDGQISEARKGEIQQAIENNL